MDIADFFKEYAGSTKFNIGADEVNLSGTRKWDYDDFPGYSSTKGSAAAYTLPAAGEAVHVYLADHTQLKELLAVKLAGAFYTDDSYAAYVSAWDAAYALDQDYDATAEQIAQAAGDLQAAQDALVVRDVTLTVQFKTRMGDVEKLMERVDQTLKWGDSYAVSLPQYKNYELSGVEGGAVVDGTICGIMEQDALEIMVWYDCLLSFGGLETALADAPAEQGSYSDESWSAYKAEYDRVNTLYTSALADPTAVTQEQLDEAVLDLQVAAAKLVYGEVKLTLRYLTIVDGKTVEISADTYYWPGMTTYTFPVRHFKNYHFSHIVGADIQFVDTGANTGTITGLLEEETVIELWYDNAPSITELELLLAGAPGEQGSYTDESWAAYQSALMAAREFYNTNSENPALKVCQADIDEVTGALQGAITGLTVVDGQAGVEIIEANPLSPTVTKGRQAVICIVTSPDVEFITVTCGDTQIMLRRCSADLASNSSGQLEKRWMVSFIMDEAGEFTYVVHGLGSDGEATADVTFTCR